MCPNETCCNTIERRIKPVVAFRLQLWLGPGGWGEGTSMPPTRPRWTRCGRSSTASPWTASSSLARARKMRCSKFGPLISSLLSFRDCVPLRFKSARNCQQAANSDRFVEHLATTDIERLPVIVFRSHLLSCEVPVSNCLKDLDFICSEVQRTIQLKCKGSCRHQCCTAASASGRPASH